MFLLFKLFLRQKLRNFKWPRFLMAAYVYFCFVMLAFALTRSIGVVIPGSALFFVIFVSCLLMALPDFFFKLFMCSNATVMDAYIKTRPITSSQWNAFLVLSQFFNSANLLMPAVGSAVFFVLMHFTDALCVVFCLYLLSVLTGISAMVVKKNSNYAEEMHGVKNGRHGRLPFVFGAVANLQYKSVFRSKRFRTTLVFGFVYSLFMCLGSAFQSGGVLSILLATLMFWMPSGILGQYGLAIEANFFNAMWTRPLPLRKVISDKYYMYLLFSTVMLSLFLILSAWDVLNISAATLFSIYLYVIGFANISVFYDAYKCKPFDLFGSVFFNYQGSSSAWRVSVIVSMLVMFGFEGAVYYFLDEHLAWANLIVGLVGVLCFLSHRWFIRSVEARFIKDKYRYMEMYNNK